MNKTTELFSTIGVHGPEAFAVVGVPHTEVYIQYRHADGALPAAWMVRRAGIEATDDRERFQLFELPSDGRPYPQRREQALNSAKTWASVRYGVDQWARTPYGTYMEAAFVKERIDKLKVEAETAKERTQGGQDVVTS